MEKSAHDTTELLVYKIVSADDWRAAEARGRFDGSEVDRRDGFIHFSSATQVRETARRHFAKATGLLLVAVDTTELSLRWEPSRGGDLFPHLYGVLPIETVRWVRPLLLDPNGDHVFPDPI